MSPRPTKDAAHKKWVQRVPPKKPTVVVVAKGEPVISDNTRQMQSLLYSFALDDDGKYIAREFTYRGEKHDFTVDHYNDLLAPLNARKIETVRAGQKAELAPGISATVEKRAHGAEGRGVKLELTPAAFVQLAAAWKFNAESKLPAGYAPVHSKPQSHAR